MSVDAIFKYCTLKFIYTLFNKSQGSIKQITLQTNFLGMSSGNTVNELREVKFLRNITIIFTKRKQKPSFTGP